MGNTIKIKSPLYIGEAVHELIKNVIRDYPIIADEGTKFPFCTWKRISGSEIGSKDLRMTSLADSVIPAARLRTVLPLMSLR